MPKIPSVNIMDLAKSLASHLETNVVGIRPGEKLHEVMCPLDDARLVLNFADHYTIQPGIIFNEHADYSVNRLGEKSTSVHDKFEYHSGDNTHFLTIDELVSLNHSLGLQ